MFVPPATLADIEAQHAAVASLCTSLLPADDVPRAFELVAEMQKLLGGASVRMASRYEQSGAWKRNGARSAEDDIARRTGTSPAGPRAPSTNLRWSAGELHRSADRMRIRSGQNGPSGVGPARAGSRRRKLSH